MKIFDLIFKELIHRKLNLILSVLAISSGVAAITALSITNNASLRETKRIMRDMGFNVRIIPKNTDIGNFYLKGFSDQTFSESSIDLLASQKNISYNHLVATLQREIEIGEMTAVIVGLSGELFPPKRKKPLMTHPIDRGTIQIGFQIAKRFSLKKGDQIKLRGHDFKIARVMPESGTSDDIKIFATLRDVQQIFGLSGQINEIKAIDCLCLTADENPQAILRRELSDLLPATQVFLISDLAETRAKQRQMIEKQISFLGPLFLILCSVILVAMVAINVRQRRTEIGILRALGYGSRTIATLFLGRSIVIGFVSAIFGFWIGSWIGITFGKQIFRITAIGIKIDLKLFLWSLLIVPIFSAIVSFIPTMIAVTQDPAVIFEK